MSNLKSCKICSAVVIMPEISFCPECLIELFKDDLDALDISENGDFEEELRPDDN